MKVLFKSTVAALALAFAITPLAAQAQTYDQYRKPGYHQQHREQVKRKTVYKKTVVHKKVVHKKWVRGERYGDWKRRPAVRDYQRYGLRAPARGQQWVKVDNSYLLVSLATGLIVGLASAH